VISVSLSRCGPSSGDVFRPALDLSVHPGHYAVFPGAAITTGEVV
jgi:hypothetical protein